jgi:hypothetical protein
MIPLGFIDILVIHTSRVSSTAHCSAVLFCMPGQISPKGDISQFPKGNYFTFGVAEYFTLPPSKKKKIFPLPLPLHRLPQIVIRQLAQYPFSAANPPSFPLGFHAPQGYDTGTTNIRI